MKRSSASALSTRFRRVATEEEVLRLMAKPIADSKRVARAGAIDLRLTTPLLRRYPIGAGSLAACGASPFDPFRRF